MTAIGPGDVVEVLDPENACAICLAEGIETPPDEESAPEVGQVLRVAGVVAEPCPGLMFAGDECYYSSCCFRKIDAPDTEISRRIRACKPVREDA